MRYPFILLIFILFLIGCNEDRSINFVPLTFGTQSCQECALVDITVPEAIGNKKIEEVINTAIREEVISILSYDEEINTNSIDTAIESFQSEYAKLKDKFPEESTKWEANVTGEITFENEKVVTVRLEYYLFTGGAHGYSSISFLNFSKEKGKELRTMELFKNLETFQELAENEFRTQEKIPESNSINSTGFMFENDIFYLPENIGFTQEGLQLFYEQYEVASYADGPIILTIPHKEIKKFLAPPIS